MWSWYTSFCCLDFHRSFFQEPGKNLARSSLVRGSSLTYSFIHVASMYCMFGTILCAGDTSVDSIPAFRELSSKGKLSNKQMMYREIEQGKSVRE